MAGEFARDLGARCNRIFVASDLAAGARRDYSARLAVGDPETRRAETWVSG